MKKVLSSKGVFEISDSLYENIKKNNPELLMEDIWDHTGSDDSGMNMFIINSLVDDIFKNEKNKNKRSINAIKQKVESIYRNKEKNSLNVLDAFDDARDYLNKVKKEYEDFKSMESKSLETTKNNKNNVDNKNISKDKQENGNLETQQNKEISKPQSFKEIDKEFNEYLNSYDLIYDDETKEKDIPYPNVEKYIKKLLELTLPEKYIKKAFERYMLTFGFGMYSDKDKIDAKEYIRRMKMDMKKFYDKVKHDCIKLKSIINNIEDNEENNIHSIVFLKNFH